MPTKKPSGPTPVESIKHDETRVNIPTEQQWRFVKKQEYDGDKVLYPRDPSLDPQLVWKGKDQQDSEDLAVPAVPIYIQEKIHPQALIENLRDTANEGHPEHSRRAEPELSLFNDFNGITEFDQKIDFYNHEQHWTNRMILGDSMLVMNSLAEKEGLKGKVQMIYIDPPYGIKFGSNWQVSTRKRDVKDGSAGDATRQPEQIKAYRDTWELGIHSYLAYLRDRLVVARELLTETGSVFVQIGDENVHLVRCLMDEVFGSENFAGCIAFVKTSSQSTAAIPSVFDYLLVYAKEAAQQKLRPVLRLKEPGERGAKQYTSLISPEFNEIRPMTERELAGIDPIPPGWEVCRLGPTTSQGYQESRSKPYLFRGEAMPIPAASHWKYDPTPGSDMDRLERIGRLRRSGKSVATVLLARDNPTTPLDNIWLDTGTGSFTEDQVYVVQTGTKAIQRCLLMTTDPGDLVLDPTCGSGTTAYVAEQWGRRWITIDTSRVALALARTRLMAAKYPYYVLSDSPEGLQKEAEITGKIPPDYKTLCDIKKGFAYRRVPHVTPKSIANNAEIDTIHARWQEKLEPIRTEINRAFGENWEEWEIPSSHESHKSHPSHSLLQEWWNLRRDRQKEIDASIAKKADTELLYDRPYEDNKTIRVTGPFTVESLSPHRRFTVEEKIDLKEKGIAGVSMKVMGGGDFALAMIDNLKKAGVQNTVKNERLKFDRLEPFAGEYLHAAGEYTENEQTKRVVVCIGPEFGTVGPELVREAAREAVQGIGFDTLVVCGFSFDPLVSEEAKQYGDLTVLAARMNPDLQMGDELLKKTGAGNLFMVFGEPDIEILRVPSPLAGEGAGDKVVVKINGLDVYDPTTGEIRSNTTDDIACWFIDTDYNGESFFVRHAYFTGADEPYEKLKRALRAEIDEATWATLYSTESRPFDPPSTGKIAVKVINHYGDEVVNVYEVK